MEVCLSHGYLNEHNITKEFVNRLAGMDSKAAQALLEKVADAKIRYYNPMLIFNLRVPRSALHKKIPSYCTYVRAATITPSMIYYDTPLVETSNRVIRQYIELEDRFLRVKFMDEKSHGRINAQSDNAFDEVFTRIKRAMTNGIMIGDRKYEFLAFGNSQFREHGAYFFAPTDHVSVEDIRQWMGDFSGIKTVAKWAARLGQCFSTTRAINGTRVTVIPIEDVKRGGYTFTDGVGKLSHFLAQMIAAEFGLSNAYHDPPSLFQFRLGGCKGVLVLAPEAKKQELFIRRSQYKFPAKHEGLEIVRFSAFAASSLNRQVILVLSILGVRDDVFRKKMQNMLWQLEGSLTDSGTALRMLQRNIDFNQMTLALASMILDGFMASKEPFLMSLLYLWRAWNIKYLKEKAKILIEKGAFLLGCVDETATLRGHFNKARPKSAWDLSALPEIFVQVSNPEAKDDYEVIKGVCIVARNPSLHPGDIRVVHAVDVPALHHLKNVLVLPQTGDRDIANMCSGGDLDGDDYLVIWDQELIPKVINHPPMNYEPQKPEKLSRPVTVDDVTSFFVTYMKNDRLGTIATAHLAYGDSSPAGVRDDKCEADIFDHPTSISYTFESLTLNAGLRLASLHSDAVDYPKSGIPATMSRDLRPKKWPHFMERKNPRDIVYQSRKILGQLYDMVERVDFVPQYANAPDERILKAYDLSDEILAQAAELKESYDTAIRRVMAQHGIRTEFEIWSTFVIDHNQESKDYKFVEELGAIAKAIKDQHRDKCIKMAGGRDFKILGPFIAAMYTVTSYELTAALEECKQKREVDGVQVPLRIMDANHMPFISFPWLFYSELGKIALGTPAERIKIKTDYDVKRASVHGRVNSSAMPGVDEGPAQDELEIGKGLTYRGDLLELFDDVSTQQTEGVGQPDECHQEQSGEVAGQLRYRQVERSLLDEPPIEMSELKDGLFRTDNLGLPASNDGAIRLQSSNALTDSETRSSPEASHRSTKRRRTLEWGLLIEVDTDDVNTTSDNNANDERSNNNNNNNNNNNKPVKNGANDDNAIATDPALPTTSAVDLQVAKSRQHSSTGSASSRPANIHMPTPLPLNVHTNVSTPVTSEPRSGSVVSCDISSDSKLSSVEEEALAAAVTGVVCVTDGKGDSSGDQKGGRMEE